LDVEGEDLKKKEGGAAMNRRKKVEKLFLEREKNLYNYT
jgi:hypothetical protein